MNPVTSSFDEKLKQNLPPTPKVEVDEKKTAIESIAETYNEMVDKQKMYSVKTLSWFYKYMQRAVESKGVLQHECHK